VLVIATGALVETVPVGTVCLTLPPPGAGTGVVARDRVVTGAVARVAVVPTDAVDVVDVPTTLELPVGLVNTVCLTLLSTDTATAVVARSRALVSVATRVAIAPVDPVDVADVPTTLARGAEEAAAPAAEAVASEDSPEPVEAAPVEAELQPAVRTTIAPVAAASATQRFRGKCFMTWYLEPR